MSGTLPILQQILLGALPVLCFLSGFFLGRADGIALASRRQRIQRWHDGAVRAAARIRDEEDE